MRKRIVATLFLTMSLLISGCTKMTPDIMEELASGSPDFDALASEMDAANRTASEDESKEASGEGITENEQESSGETNTTNGGSVTTQPSETGQVITQQQTAEAVTTEAPATKPAATEAPTTKPAATEAPTTKPAATKPAATEAPTTKPATTKPAATEVPTTKPATTKPATTEAPTTEQPTTKQPATEAKPVVSADNGVLKTFSVMSLDGKTYTQDVFTKADVNVVIFWTTWCGYCKMEMPVLEKLHTELNGRSIQFFNVCLNADGEYYRNQAKTLIEEMGITYPSLIYNDSMSDGYVSEITGYPRTVYLNRRGEIMFEIGGAYAGYGEDYALGMHRDYAEYCLTYPDYLPAE